jgi:hypothetical protein
MFSPEVLLLVAGSSIKSVPQSFQNKGFKGSLLSHASLSKTPASQKSPRRDLTKL